MKFKISLAAALFIAVAAHAAPPAGSYRTNTIDVASGLASVNNGTSNSTAGAAFAVPQGVALNIDYSFVAANAGTSNVLFSLNLSSDGTHYTTTLPFTFTAACNGTTAVIGHTNIPAASLTGVQYVRLDQVSTTQTNAVTVTALYTSFWQ